MNTATNEPPVFADELKALLGFAHTNTLRVQIKAGKVPPPDVRISQKSRYWHRETLRKFCILPPVDYPTTPAVDVAFPKAPKRPLRTPSDDQVQAWMSDADKAGLRWVEKTRPKYCLYTFVDCGHSQEIGYKDVRSGSLKCRACLADRYAKEAREAGLTLVSHAKARTGLFKFNDCGHEREIPYKEVRKNAFICQICESSWATRTSNLYVHLITLQGEQLIKVGISRSIPRRIGEYGLPPDATVQTLFTGNFATGKAASDAESQLLQKFKSHRLKNVDHIMQKSGSTECFCPSIIHDVVAIAKSLSGAGMPGYGGNK